MVGHVCDNGFDGDGVLEDGENVLEENTLVI